MFIYLLNMVIFRSYVSLPEATDEPPVNAPPSGISPQSFALTSREAAKQGVKKWGDNLWCHQTWESPEVNGDFTGKNMGKTWEKTWAIPYNGVFMRNYFL